MKRSRTAVAGCLLALAAAGCGIRPTGVTDGGTAPSGISQGMRIYFASDSGPRGVPRPGATIDQLDDAFKLLAGGPTAAERADGLGNLIPAEKGFTATSRRGSVTVDAPGYAAASPQDPATGQLVCTLARAEVLLHGTRPDKVQVTIAGADGRAGPYQCQQFLPR
ncbi:GerMN domain-containing protein [Streptomyces sp. NPDC054765]